MTRLVFQSASCLAVALLTLAGCATPDGVSGRDKTDVPTRSGFTRATDAGRVQDNWILTFQDATLIKLVEEAQKNNPDLALAAGRRDEAQARARKAGAALSPQIGAGIGGATGDSGLNRTQSSSANLGLTISWEVDVWGRLRQGSAAAQQDALAAAADYEFARQSIAAQTAEAWFYAITASQQTELDKDLLGVYQKTLDITTARKSEGVASQMDVDLAAGNVANARQALARSEGAQEEAVRSLEALLGRYPAAELEVAARLPSMPGPTPTGLPTELLERRPDMVAADRQVAAAFFRTGSAKAAKLPSLSIDGNLGMLLNPSAAVWSLGANLLAPVVDGGARQADVEIAEGQQKQALAFYVRTAISGFREVETAMANEGVLLSREKELDVAAERFRKARTSAEVSYKEGVMSLVDVTTIQAQDYQSRVELLRVRGERLQQRINLHLALGGSFDAR